MLHVTTTMDGEVAVVTLDGRLAVGDGPSPFVPTINQLVQNGRVKVVLDLGGVTFLDSYSLGVLVAKTVSVRAAGGDITLVHPSPRSAHVLMITNLASLFQTYPTVDAAVASFATM